MVLLGCASDMMLWWVSAIIFLRLMALLGGCHLRGHLLRGCLLVGHLFRGFFLRGHLLRGHLFKGRFLRGRLLRAPLLRGCLLRRDFLKGLLLRGWQDNISQKDVIGSGIGYDIVLRDIVLPSFQETSS